MSKNEKASDDAGAVHSVAAFKDFGKAANEWLAKNERGRPTRAFFNYGQNANQRKKGNAQCQKQNPNK